MFNIPPEPVELKQQWKERLGGGEAILIKGQIKQGAWLTACLWDEYGWEKELGRRGITWIKFEGLYRNCRYCFLDWVEGKISWNEAMSNLIGEIEGLGHR